MSEFFSSRPLISVFGSHAPGPGSEDYELAREVGRRLAMSGFGVATGGYSGTMAAVSQGAAEAGGYVLGVTSGQIEKIRQAKLNPWVTNEIRYETLSARALHLVTKNDGIIVLSGGIGTLSEFALAWSLMQAKEIPLRPLILLGEIWHHTMDRFANPDYINPEHLALIEYAVSPEQAIAQLKSFPSKSEM